MDYKDYYKILGVGRKAGTDEIKRAYRKLAMQYHPDRNPGNKHAEERFKEINEAYQVLGDRQKRARYDQLGDSYSRWQRNGAPGNFNWDQWSARPGGAQQVDFDDLFGDGMFSDFFRSIFGPMGAAGGTPGRRARTPAHATQPVAITLREAYNGATRLLQGRQRRAEVKLPPGARSGTKVRVPGGGPPGPDGQPSDLYLVLEVTPDPLVGRDGDDLRAQVNVDVFTAILGGEAPVETLAGKVILTIPPATQPEQVFRIGGRGMPHLKDPQVKGDLYVRLKVQIPRQLTARQKSLLEQAAGRK